MTGWWFQIYLHTSPIESWSLMRVSLRSPNHSDVRLGVLGLVTSTWDFSVESVLFVFNHRFDRRLPEEPPEGRPEPGSTGFFSWKVFGGRFRCGFSAVCSEVVQVVQLLLQLVAATYVGSLERCLGESARCHSDWLAGSDR